MIILFYPSLIRSILVRQRIYHCTRPLDTTSGRRNDMDEMTAFLQCYSDGKKNAFCCVITINFVHRTPLTHFGEIQRPVFNIALRGEV
jgi:hypothetical protein